MKQQIIDAFSPNADVSKTVIRIVIFFEVVIAIVLWSTWQSPIIPNPLEVAKAFKHLWFEEALFYELLTSVRVTLEALLFSTIISLGLAYLTVVPAVRPVVELASKFRFLGLVGLSLPFTLMMGVGHGLKVALLTFGMTVFFVTSMASVVAQIPREKFDHARTLRMSQWRAVWDVVILGTLDEAIDVMRQNAAIAWMMLTAVEGGIVRTEGGMGVLLMNQNKHFLVANVYAGQLTILLFALLCDYAIGAGKNLVCPYARISLERR